MVRRRDAGEEQLGGSHYSWRNECALGGFVCYEYGDDSDTLSNMAVNIFVGLLIAWAVAVVCSYASRAGGRTRWSFYWVGSLMFTLCCIQYYFVFLAANTLPPSATEEYVRRYDCMKSTKGGKRSSDSDKNKPGTKQSPCFCHDHAYCVIKDTGEVVHPSACPDDGSAECFEGPGEPVNQYIKQRWLSDERDCAYGRGAKCTKDDPCTPCEIEKVVHFKDNGYCNLCSDINPGHCHFKPGVGPYCRVEHGSAAIEPCGTCCTWPEPYFEVKFYAVYPDTLQPSLAPTTYAPTVAATPNGTLAPSGTFANGTNYTLVAFADVDDYADLGYYVANYTSCQLPINEEW